MGRSLVLIRRNASRLAVRSPLEDSGETSSSNRSGCFGLRRKGNEAIRSFHGAYGNRGNGASAVCSDAVPRRAFAYFRRAAKAGRPQAKCPRPALVPASAGNRPKLFRIRRWSLLFVPLSRRLRRASFFEGQRKRQKRPPEGTYFEAVPSGLPPRRPRGPRPPLDSPGAYEGRELAVFRKALHKLTTLPPGGSHIAHEWVCCFLQQTQCFSVCYFTKIFRSRLHSIKCPCQRI